MSDEGRQINPMHESMASPLLPLASAVLDETERVNIANQNRLRQFIRTGNDSDGVERGFGLMPPDVEMWPESNPIDCVLEASRQHIEIQRAAGRQFLRPPKTWSPLVWQMCLILPPLMQANKDATRAIEQLIQEHPLCPWIDAQKGLGRKQVGRLLAVIGDPWWNVRHERPRTVSELWSYCGFAVTADGTAPVRRRGVRVSWSMEARMRCRMIAESCMKTNGGFREVYDEEKWYYCDDVHQVPCVRCGPSGSPALPGTPLSKNHIHARALRSVSKEVLRGLWRESRRIHLDHEAIDAVAA
jgi:hypothetical protein